MGLTDRNGFAQKFVPSEDCYLLVTQFGLWPI